MKGRVGTKNYDTEKSELIETRDDGIQVYRKKGRSAGHDYFFYNPQGKTAKEKFFDLSPEEVINYIPENTKSKKPDRKASRMRFSPYDLERIRTLALLEGMPMNRFVMMLVDEYEKRNS